MNPRMLFVLVVTLVAGVGCNARLPGKPDPANRERRPEQITDFGTLYSVNCSGCHGEKGTLGPAPPLNDPLFLAIVPAAELSKVIRQGRVNTPMPAFAKSEGGPLTDQQVTILAQGLRGWASSKERGEGAPPYVAPVTKEEAGAEEIRNGAKAYARACSKCHGEKGEGTDVAGAINEPAFLGLLSDQALRRLIITGRPDLGMPDFRESKGRGENFKRLTAQEVTSLVAYLGMWRESLTGLGDEIHPPRKEKGK